MGARAVGGFFRRRLDRDKTQETVAHLYLPGAACWQSRTWYGGVVPWAAGGKERGQGSRQQARLSHTAAVRIGRRRWGELRHEARVNKELAEGSRRGGKKYVKSGRWAKQKAHVKSGYEGDLRDVKFPQLAELGATQGEEVSREVGASSWTRPSAGKSHAIHFH